MITDLATKLAGLPCPQRTDFSEYGHTTACTYCSGTGYLLGPSVRIRCEASYPGSPYYCHGGKIWVDNDSSTSGKIPTACYYCQGRGWVASTDLVVWMKAKPYLRLTIYPHICAALYIQVDAEGMVAANAEAAEPLAAVLLALAHALGVKSRA